MPDSEVQGAVCGTCGQPRSSSAHTSQGAAIDHRFIPAPVVPCGTCGQPPCQCGDARLGAHHTEAWYADHDFTLPSPVVPSDDECCEHGSDSHGAYPLIAGEPASVAPGTRFCFACDDACPTPPTPSQDAHAHEWIEVGGSGPYCRICGQWPSQDASEVERNSSISGERATSQDAEGDGRDLTLEELRDAIARVHPLHGGGSFIIPKPLLARFESAIRAPYEDEVKRLREALEWVLGESDWRLEYYASTPAPIAIDTTDKYRLRVRTAEEMAALESLGGRS